MKKIVSLILCLALSASLVCYADAPEITVNVNGKKLETDVRAQLVNDRTMLPMRAIFESLGATVTWMERDRMIFATKDACMIVLQIGNEKMSVQRATTKENTAVVLDAAPFILDGRTLVPVRAIAEALNAKVAWNGETYTVDITTN